jgi:phosphatidylserine/phosphatidylglycerophosphate/cardiolipin synthase-like enzyme
LNKGGLDAGAPEIHYAPEENLSRIDVALTENAATEIDMAAYVLTDWAIIDALNDAEARGVKVRVVLDPKEHSDTSRMVGPDVKIKRPGPIQHLKALEIDGQILRTGSENFSHSAPMRDNDLIVIRDTAAAMKFEAHFDRMWTAPFQSAQIRRRDRCLRPARDSAAGYAGSVSKAVENLCKRNRTITLAVPMLRRSLTRRK